jgi:hypothetical protein
VIVLTGILDQLMLQIATSTDEWIRRNILKMESQSEHNNLKHWIAKHVLPFQGWEVSFVCIHPKVLIKEQAT